MPLFSTLSDRQRLQRLWQRVVEPTPMMTDPVRRLRMRILNSILVVIIPIALITLLIYLFILPEELAGRSVSILAITMGVAVATFIYLINHTRHYKLSRYFTIIVGFAAITINAYFSAPPHVEIAYLILLPLVGNLLFTFRETIVISVLATLSFLVFAYLIGDIPADVVKDMITFLVFVQVFILFLSQQRNRLEADRQVLAIERERNRLLKDLITNLSHDFRTPLTVIMSSTHLLGRIKDPARQQEKLDQIHRQAQRLDRMIDAILTISALDQPFDQVMERHSVNTLLEALYQRYSTQADEKAIPMRLNLHESKPVLMDADNLQLAFAQLIENAISYTGSGGHIRIASFIEGDAVVVEVEDSGKGIAGEDLPHIFTPFFRVDCARSTDDGGMGLGLPIAARIIELHHGTLSVESVPGQGSTFRIHLPIDPATA